MLCVSSESRAISNFASCFTSKRSRRILRTKRHSFQSTEREFLRVPLAGCYPPTGDISLPDSFSFIQTLSVRFLVARSARLASHVQRSSFSLPFLAPSTRFFVPFSISSLFPSRPVGQSPVFTWVMRGMRYSELACRSART